MATIRRKDTGKWEITLSKYYDGEGLRFKVTRRFPELSIAETRIFTSIAKAKKQFGEWLK